MAVCKFLHSVIAFYFTKFYIGNLKEGRNVNIICTVREKNMKKQERKRRISIILLIVLLVVSIIPTQSISAAEKTKLNVSKASIVKGQSIQLRVQGTVNKVVWKTSDKKIVTVSKKGKVRAKSSGKAIITAEVGNKSLKCKITVKNMV